MVYYHISLNKRQALIRNFGQKGGGGANWKGGAYYVVTGPLRQENGLVVPGKFTASTKSVAKRTLQVHRDGNNYK